MQEEGTRRRSKRAVSICEPRPAVAEHDRRLGHCIVHETGHEMEAKLPGCDVSKDCEAKCGRNMRDHKA